MPDPLALAAAGMLLLIVVSRIAFTLLAPEALRAHDVLPADSTAFPKGRLVLLAASGDATRLRSLEASARRAGPDLPLVLRTITPNANPAGHRLQALVRSYGYEELPVLLTLDAYGRVLRVTPL